MIFNLLIITSFNLIIGYQESFPFEKLIEDMEVISLYKNQTQDTLVIQNDTISISCSIQKNNNVLEVRLRKKTLSENEWVLLYRIQGQQPQNSYILFKVSKYFKGKRDGIEIIQSGYYRIYRTYFNDKRHGQEFIYLNINNKPVIYEISNYADDKLNGKVYLFENGLLRGSTEFRKGIPKGERIIYHENGIIREIGQTNGYFSFIKLDDDDFYWYYNGKRKTNFNSKDLNTMCFMQNNFPDYLPKCEIDVLSGNIYPKRIGIWRYYDSNGILLFEKKYR